MTRQAQVLALVRSFSEGDSARFEAVALQLASEAARNGQTKLADQIRVLITEARAKADAHVEKRSGPVPVVRPKGELAGLVAASYPLVRLENLVLDEDTLKKLRDIVEEHIW